MKARTSASLLLIAAALGCGVLAIWIVDIPPLHVRSSPRPGATHVGDSHALDPMAEAGQSSLPAERPREFETVITRDSVLSPGGAIVRVVSEPGGEGVGGALVWWASEETLCKLRKQSEEYEPYFEDNYSRLMRGGPGMRTDERGETRLGSEDELGHGLLVAEHEGAWGAREVRVGTGPAVIEVCISIDDSIGVRVVDSRGGPVFDVVVAFGLKDGNMGMQSRRGITRPPDGVATIRGIREVVEKFQDASCGWCVCTVLPNAMNPHVDIDVTQLPRSMLSLELPDSSTLSLRLIDRCGEPVSLKSKAHITAFPRDGGGCSRTAASVFESTFSVEHGLLEFDHFGGGLCLFVQVECCGVNIASGMIEGPLGVGERCQRELAAAVGPYGFLGRLVNRAGVAIPNKSFSIIALDRQSDGQEATHTRDAKGQGVTDAEGGFAVSVENLIGPFSRFYNVEIEVFEGAGTLRANRPASLFRSVGRLRADIGDVVME